MPQISLTMSDLLQDKAYVNGTWIDADSGARIAVNSPADDSIFGTVPDLGGVETSRAIAAAEAALPAWRALAAVLPRLCVRTARTTAIR